MRPIHKVIEAIKKMVPEDTSSRADLIYDLDDILDSASYSAPELTGMLWDRLCESLDVHLGSTGSVKWKQDIQDLMSTKIDYRTVLGE